MGRVFWITGLSGSGKTTLATRLCEELKKQGKQVVLLDGDQLRKYVFPSAGYTYEDRLSTGMQYSGLCEMLSNQGVTVVCAVVVLFHQVQERNRANIPQYTEIFLKAPEEVLISKNKKGLYQGDRKNAYGVDIVPEYPKKPEFIIENHHVEKEKELEESIRLILREDKK